MNEVTLLGRPTKEIEIQYTNKNTEYVRFSLAVNTGYGEYARTTYVNCLAYKKNAKALFKVLKEKGRVLLKGELINNDYEDKDGKKVYSMNLLVNSVIIIDYKDNLKKQELKENIFTEDENFVFPDEQI